MTPLPRSTLFVGLALLACGGGSGQEHPVDSTAARLHDSVTGGDRPPATPIGLTPTQPHALDTALMVAVSLDRIGAVVTLELPDGRRLVDSSPIPLLADSLAKLPPASQEVDCDCGGEVVGANNVTPGTGVLTIQARSSGSAWLEVTLSSRRSSGFGRWTVDSLPLQRGERRRYEVYFPALAHPESLLVTPVAPR